jgi:methylglutaconyl-CoA hydratase
MKPQTILVEKDAGIASLMLNRPQVHNAFNEEVIAELTTAFISLDADKNIRAVLLKGAGKSFSAGADLAWMRKMAAATEPENRADAMRLAELLKVLDRLQKPTIAVVQGAAFGGGIGLIAACDIAIAAESASFCLSEVKLGLIPAAISPYVIAAIGERACRRYFLTAERFSSTEAHRLGLIHQVVADESLNDAVHAIVAQLKMGGPQAQSAAKDLIHSVTRRPVDDVLIEDTARRIAAQRMSEEGREGVGAFLAKRKPAWIGDA